MKIFVLHLKKWGSLLGSQICFDFDRESGELFGLSKTNIFLT
jgi:hypothetical protein